MPKRRSSAKKVLGLVLPEYKSPMPSMVNKVDLDSIFRPRKIAALTPSATAGCKRQSVRRHATKNFSRWRQLSDRFV
jgi:hypothetical protein